MREGMRGKDRPKEHLLYFVPREALAIGLNEAIVLARLRFWLERTAHILSGRPWVYNTYTDWQGQFPFWSERTIKAVFRRLERLGIVESTQRFNQNRWHKTKWYTINENALTALTSAEALINGTVFIPIDETHSGAIDGTPIHPIDSAQICPIDGADIAPSLKTERSSIRSTKRSSPRACAGEPAQEARPHPPQTPPAEDTRAEEIRDEVDAAFERMPPAEQSKWLDRARQELQEKGPEWMAGSTPAVWNMAVHLWEQALR